MHSVLNRYLPRVKSDSTDIERAARASIAVNSARLRRLAVIYDACGERSARF